MRRSNNQRGIALVETALTIPMLLLVAAGICEFGRAYQTWLVLSNASREAARIAILPNGAPSDPTTRALHYMQDGGLQNAGSAVVTVNKAASFVVNGSNVSATQVSIDYPFEFTVLQPVARLIQPTTTLGSALTIHTKSLMRNEAP